ncbi:protocatechuate 3,4-dioxygenase subunit alpha [Kibdelosporangium lantanae]
MTMPSQTVGPFLSIGLPWPDGPTVVPSGTPGAIMITGTVYDGAGLPVPDALVETWQADPDGNFDHPESPAPTDFRGFGRCPTEPDGTYWIRTLRPGRLPGQARHIDVSVFARGLLNRVVTRIYFPEDLDDPVLESVPADRRHTLIATPTEDGYRFDIRLQGPDETVFFDV